MYKESSSSTSRATWLMYFLLILYFFFPGCADNAYTREWDIDQEVSMKCGQKLVNANWERNDIIYTTRAMRPGETAEKTELHLKVNWYLFGGAGVVTFKECGAGMIEDSPQ